MTLVLALLLGSAAGPATIDTVRLEAGMVITRSVVVRPGSYRLQPSDGDSAVVRIRGDGLVVDFSGATLIGAPPDAPPDAGQGIGVLVEGGRAITVRRARIRGFKVAILARDVRGLRLIDNDVSYNWKPRLWSGPGHESLVDWLSFHHNERDEWLRYGAGLYLTGVIGGEIRGNTARQGMNGLLLVRSDSLTVWNNDFSFLSGLGVGLYRASWNRILHNRVDYCVRGFSHGAYDRGQDSAALLLYEQSSHNLVAYNSMTHGGDGLFLWAGQSTMDGGTGGANDNLFFGNDFSFAVTNGMEATFSRNRFVGNLIEGAHHGLWGGYSWESEIRGNRFGDNVVGIAIEHGQDNRIEANWFERDSTAIRLWGNPIEPSDWGYPRYRDTRSRDYRIVRNHFTGNRTALRLERTERVVAADNTFSAVDTALSAAGDTAAVELAGSRAGERGSQSPWRPDLADSAAPARMRGGLDPFGRGRRGRPTILIDEWGPYDWLAPRLWPAALADSAAIGGPRSLVVFGPPGRWRVVAHRGLLAVTPMAGRVGDTVRVRAAPGQDADWELELEYRGRAVVSDRGAVTPAGTPYRFRTDWFRVPIDWSVAVAPFDSASDPRSRPDAVRALFERPPPITRRDSALDYEWYRPKLPGFPAERFAVVATGAVDLPAGDFDLVTISDDGIRVWVDDSLVIDHWSAHESAVDRAPIAAGVHTLRIEYYQIDGWLELRAEIRKRPPR